MSGEKTAGIVVAGYASVDYALILAPFRGTDATTIVKKRAEVWPRVGGIAHVTAAISRAASLPVSALSWIGDDAEGRLWRAAVASAGVDVSGVLTEGKRSPSSHLLYPEDGGTMCLFDPADCHPGKLPDPQATVVRGARWIVLTVGPVEATRDIVNAVGPTARLVWVVKHDADSIPPELRGEILRRADIVTLSESERGFIAAHLDQLRPGVIVVETRGTEGARVLEVRDGELVETGAVAASPVNDVDTTGAGDTFTGTFVAALADDPAQVLDASSTLNHLRRASQATHDLLQDRKDASSHSGPN